MKKSSFENFNFFQNIKKLKFKAILFLISFFLLSFIIWNSNPIVLFSLIQNSNKIYIFLGLVVSLFVISLRVLKWKFLLNDVNFFDLYPIQLFGITISNFTPGKIGEPFKAFLLKMTKGFNVSKTLPTILWERILDILVLLGFSFFIINFINFDFLIYPTIISILIFLIVVIFFLVILKNKNFGTKVFKFFKKIPFFKNISENFIDTFYKSKIKNRKIIYSFFTTLSAWLFEGFVIYFAFLSLGVDKNPLFFSSLVAISVLIAVASSLPGGLGSFEIVSVLILTNIGIENSLATAGIVLYRFLSFGLSSFIGFLSFIYLRKYISKINYNK